MSSSERSPGEPKYVAVKRHLLELIDGLSAGAPVPTERALAEELGTSRTTTRQALNELVAQGRLVRRQGSGTFVAEAKMTWPLYLASFTEQAQANGMVPTSRLLGTARESADAEIADRLAVGIGDPVYRIDRLRLGDGVPLSVESSVLSADRLPGLTRRMHAAESLHTLLSEDYRVQLMRGEESIEIQPAGPLEAELLGTAVGAPLLVVKRHSFDRDGTPVEWGTSWLRGDRFTFVAHLETRQ